ncbi:MAG: hypothetical protein COA82_04175 [Alkaliphilus sp.]|nr:MAG: hypothetical protein COA82_04175 [Alkaliphilus sp.]
MKKRQSIKEYYIAIFKSRNYVMHLHQHLNRKGLLEYELISTPCKIEAGCSYSLKFYNLQQLDVLLRESRLINRKIDSIYLIERKNKKRYYSEIDFYSRLPLI